MERGKTARALLLAGLLLAGGIGLKCEYASAEERTSDLPGLTYDHSMELIYAQNFSVDYYEGEYALITIKDGGRFLVVPEGAAIPEGLDPDIVTIQQPVQEIYLVAAAAMDLFRAVDGLGAIGLSGTQEDSWYIPEAREAMEQGEILYAGKYSAPDYELILKEGCDLAIESTMIYHTPEVKEKLEEFGIPVLVENSSYESHPLGRTEWMKLYAVLLDKEEQAEAVFEKQAEKLKAVESEEETDKTVAFFYISSNGYANVRKSGDYVSKMIDLAGGAYIFQDLGDTENALSTMNMQMEEFYAGAKEADYIIYNSTIDGELQDLQGLLGKNPLLKDFKAVKEGQVWCTTQNLYQETTSLADMIVDIHTILTEEEPEDQQNFIYRLK